MKTLLFSVALLLGAGVSSASAQYIAGPVTTFYAPAGRVVAPAYSAPVFYPNRTTYYAPGAVAPAGYYSPTPVYSSYYAPAAPVNASPVYSSYYAPAYAPAYAAPVVVGRPVVAGRTIYGTRQVYVPGQPVLNTVRAVTP
ncbi:hypothetical protein NA78x_005985 [Anatilimnocola sp. NA78]|uniref:hypothetical protein n=1 Tax=Anatilimnocola sp. NA78 TaxID=3415683 RepID=UPI003CE4C120